MGEAGFPALSSNLIFNKLSLFHGFGGNKVIIREMIPHELHSE
jgi:hypothetical protein